MHFTSQCEVCARHNQPLTLSVAQIATPRPLPFPIRDDSPVRLPDLKMYVPMPPTSSSNL